MRARVSRVYRNGAGRVRQFFAKTGNLRLEDPLPARLDQIWVGDLIYLRLGERWRFLATVMDLFSRRIVGWTLSRNRTTEVTLRALERAIARYINRFYNDKRIHFGPGVPFPGRVRMLGQCPAKCPLKRMKIRIRKDIMPLLGSAAMLLSFDIEADAIAEHDRWHTHEHLPERLSIPGFRRGTRWIATGAGPRYMVLYEVEGLETLASQAYLERLNNPSPWTRRMMPHYRGMTRGLCRVLGSFGFGLGGMAALIRFAPEASRADALHSWLLEEALAAVPAASGLGSAHLLQGAQAAQMTNEQRIRGADRGIETAVIVTGYEREAVAEFARGLCDGGAIAARGEAGPSWGMYQWHYSLDSAEVGA